MEMSSSSSASCFDFALGYLGWMNKTLRYHLYLDIWNLREEVRLLQTFDLYLTKCRRRRNHETCLQQEVEEKDVTSFRIRNLINKRMPDLEFACSQYLIHSHSFGLTSELTKFREAIELFFETDITESCIHFMLDCYWLRDPELVIDFIDSVSKNLAKISRRGVLESLEWKLMFLKSFIRVAMLHGVEGQELIDLLIHAEVVAINALRLLSTWWSAGEGEVRKEMELQISQLIDENINPSDPQVRETYIHVLTASKLSRSSDTSALEKNKHLVVDFLDYLVHNIMEQLESCTNILVPNLNHIQKLHDGLRFLTALLSHQKKFEELRHEMKTLTGVVVCDAAIVFFSLSVNQSIEEGLAKETDLALFHLHKVLKLISAEVIDPVTSELGFGFPRTNELGSMDFLLENLRELARCHEINGSIAFPVHKIQAIQRDFEFFRSFLEKIKEKRNQNKKLQAFWGRVMEVAYKAELVVDSTLVGDGGEYRLDAVARDINLMKIEAQEIYGSISYDGETKRVTKTFTRMPSQFTAATCNEDLLHLDNEVESITHRLTGGLRQLDVVPIVGMPGLGKTTLASIVYNSPSIMLHFHIRAWCTVSQVYTRQNLLVQILSNIDSGSPVQYLEEDEHDLAARLKQSLLRNRYLLVLDDLWNVEAWNLLERSLPDDANGSRIIITSRLQNLSLQFKPDSKALHLRHLTDEESWKLLQKKLFGKEGCPAKLSGIGFEIAKSCRGLPLKIVLVAGILNTAQNFWEEVAESLSSSIVLDEENCMKTLELSYSHLPDDLKSCLLYFSAFQEDKDVPVRRLLWLWISEGFVQNNERKSIDDVADDYLRALVDRSLVMVTKQRTTGGAKACRLHDLIHEFCVKKAKEENFLHVIHCEKNPSSLTGLSNPHRVCDQNTKGFKIQESMLFFPNLRTLLFSNTDYLGFWLPKLLRVLDLGDLFFTVYFPMEVVLLVHLRYLALRVPGMDSIPSSIANLSRLQTFAVGASTNLLLPKTIWNIKTLRHLHHASGSICGFIFPIENLEESPCLDHLDTLDLAIDPSSESLQMILTKLPSIRRLKCRSVGSREEPTRTGKRILEFDCLSQLESLNLDGFYGNGFKFPLNLKKLTLSNNKQPWGEISSIGKLPNLEVLKLLVNCFVGEEWEVKDEEFPNLRAMKLLGLDIRSWTASSDNFPRLEKLVVDGCPSLKKVPSCLGECPNLAMIQVKWCRQSVVSSVEQIREEQKDAGNEDLQIIIENCDSEEEEEESSPSETEPIPSQGV